MFKIISKKKKQISDFLNNCRYIDTKLHLKLTLVKYF